MTVDYKISSDAPYTIIIEGEGSFAPFEEYMDGKVIETLDGKLCEIPFTPENATKLRQFLRGKDFEIPDREKALLAYLADHPEALDDKEINWTMELTELRHNKAPGRFTKIKTEWDLLHYMPLRYLDKTNPQSVSELVEGQWSVVTGVLVADPEYRPHGDPNKEFVKIVISDIKNTRISATFFRQKWLAWKFKAGDEVVLYGTFKIYSNPRNGARFPQMANAKIDKIDHNVRHNLNMVPIYPQKSEDKSWQLQVAQEKMINNIVWMEDPVPAQILKKYEFLSRNEAYRLIHFPNSREDVERASRRIAFDEFVRLQVFLANKKEGVEETPSSAKELHSWADAFTNSLPFDFTNAQNRVIGEITADLASQKPMYRLLQGDVGSGKALPLYAKVLTPSGYRLMKDMKVGDLVVTPSGGITSVVGAFPQKGKRPIYELQFDDGTKARSDLEHLWSVSQALEDEDGIVEYLPNKVITTKEIIKNGLKRYGSDGAKWFIDNPNFEAISGYLTLDASKPERAVRKAITHIAYVGEEDAKCIKLADPSGLFITDDYTVTHNTEISSVATLIAAESGYQTALLAPTDILASQLYERLSKTFAKAGLGDDKVKFALINGRVKGKARTALLKEIKEGDITIVVGTHAILQKDVEFHNLGLVVIDEQHKFGAEQRSTLRRQDEHGRIPDLLTMSATPIPRTTSQVVYGDMDISIVDELPAERIPIETEWHETPDFAWSKIREEVEAGHQAYVVASLVEDTEKLENIESAQATYENLAFNVFPDLKVGLLHGRLGRDEKKEVIDRFYAKEIDILVATTVVEVGVNVPNATIMTILNANRFGIASLHQIRGRVGRGALKSYCYLIGEATSLEAEERLNALVESNDGFVLAEKDLEIRGEGSLFGQLQSGANDLFVGNLKEHKDLLDLAKRVAKQAKSSRILKAEVDLLYSGKEIRA